MYYNTEEHNVKIELRMRLLQYATTNYYTRSRKSKWLEVFTKCQVRWAIITVISTLSDWIRVYAEKLVNAPKSHKIEYAPMHTIWVITRLAWNARKTDRVSASISYEHCRSSRNNPHCAPRHIIYYSVPKKPILYLYNGKNFCNKISRSE